MRVFYVRCSTIEQNEARQLKMAQEQNAEKVFVDKASGKNTDRAAFKEMMSFVRAGDTVVVESISRIARNTRYLLSIVSELTEKGGEVVSLKEHIDKFFLALANRNIDIRVLTFSSANKPCRAVKVLLLLNSI